MTVVLDEASKGAATVISGGGLHCDVTDSISDGGARSDLKHDNLLYASPQNRFWVEFTCVFNSLGNSSGIGVTPAAFPNFVQLAINGLGGLIIYKNGQIKLNGVIIATTVPGGVGHTSTMLALDMDNNLLWAKTPGIASWNGTLGADPDTGVGGIDISSISAGGLYAFGEIGTPLNDFDANFGASAPVNTAPSTFGPWQGVPPTPTPTLHAVQNARMAPFTNVFTATAQISTVLFTLDATEPSDEFFGEMAPSVGLTMSAIEPSDTFAVVPPDRANLGVRTIPEAFQDDDTIYVLENNETLFIQGDFSSDFVIPTEDTMYAT